MINKKFLDYLYERLEVNKDYLAKAIKDRSLPQPNSDHHKEINKRVALQKEFVEGIDLMIGEYIKNN